jgi:hypothetical protein
MNGKIQVQMKIIIHHKKLKGKIKLMKMKKDQKMKETYRILVEHQNHQKDFFMMHRLA